MDKWMTQVLCEMERASKRFHRATHNGVQFKMYESFVSGIFHLVIFS
jgi:hypothetical protein